jgi:hypothetical protein
LTSGVVSLSEDALLHIHGGNKIADYISGACAAYGTYAIIALTAGVTAIGVGSVGAFCAGFKLADWLF